MYDETNCGRTVVDGPRVAVVGCGFWGRNLVRNFNELGALAAICDADRETAEAAALQCGAPVSSWGAVLGSPAIDGVVIAAPASKHHRMVLSALRAGKHVFVEKPLALRMSEARSDAARARAAGKVLMVGHLLQYHPAFLALKKLVADGVLGRLRYIYSNRLSLGRIRQEENVLWSFAPHDVSMVLALAGDRPTQVYATGAGHVQEGIADMATVHLAFPDDMAAHVCVSWLHPFKEQKLVAVGERAMAVFDDCRPWSGKLEMCDYRIDRPNGVPRAIKGEGIPIPLDPAEPLREECEHFLASMTTGSAPRTDSAEGVRVLQVLDAAEKAMRSGRAQCLEAV